ncbi:hypothetical protein GO305_02086 [Ralstonia solanacearum]|nr:hypothetical protein [Ralstonia solanacearum]
MEGVRNRQRAGIQLLRIEPGTDGVDAGGAAGEHHVLRAIDGGERHLGRDGRRERCQQVVGVPRRGARGQHGAARGQRLHERAAAHDQACGILQRHRSGNDHRRELADGVADQDRGHDAPGLPHGGQRVAAGEQRRLRMGGLLQGIALRVVVHQREDGAPQVRRERGVGGIERGAEVRLRGVQRARHAGVLGTLAGEQEADARRARDGLGRGGVRRGQAVQRACAFVVVRCHDGGAQGVMLALARHAVGEHGQVGRAGEGVAIGGSQPAQRIGGAGGQQEQVRPARRFRAGCLRHRCLLQDHMRDGAGKAVRRHAGAAHGLARRPVDRVRRRAGRNRIEIDQRIDPLQPHQRRDARLLQRQHGLDQPGRAGGGF